MSDVRDAVISNARYLRNVRPIDPDEIADYVESQPHPAVVREYLREAALDLRLLERADGTFVPVPEEPLRPQSREVDRFPDHYTRRLTELLAERYGPNWFAGPSGDLLRSTIRRFKADYLERRPVAYDEDVAAGYAIYHLPGYYAAIQYALDDLAENAHLGRTLRVLDVGAGVGGPALGLFEYLPEDCLVEYHAVEPGEGATILEAFLEETGRNVHATVHRTTIEAFDPTTAIASPRDDDSADAFDLVLACNVLSELEDPAAVLRHCLECLAPSGSLLAMAPADKHTSIQLRRLERELEGGLVSPGGGLEGGLRLDDGGERPEGSENDGGERPEGGEDDGKRLEDSASDGSTGRADDANDDSSGRTDDPDREGVVTVYAPMVRFWPGDTPTNRAWSFDRRPDLEIPGFQRQLEEHAGNAHTPGEFVNVDVQFSYSILRLDGRRRIDLTLDASQWARMAEMDRHVTNRVDLVAAKLSHTLSERADASKKNPVILLSDGSEQVDHFAVCTNETALNRPLLEADYGDVLEFEGVLVLWNDDEGAYNLVVDEETVVDRVV